MIQNNKPNMKLLQRMTEEAQLLAEEKWIIDSLKKIKAQRNALQIERLHLESMRAKLIANKSQTEEPAVAKSSIVAPSTSTENILSTNTTNQLEKVPQIDPLQLASSITDLDESELCNTETLDLAVTNPVFNIGQFGETNDEEDEESDMDDCVLDLDLLMNEKAHHKSNNDDD